jgi:hypothetical protein
MHYMCIWAARLNMVRLRFETCCLLSGPPCARSATLVAASHLFICLRGLTNYSSWRSRRIIKFSHPPTLGGGPGGQPQLLPAWSSYLIFHPSRATLVKSNLPSFLGFCIVLLSYGHIAHWRQPAGWKGG